MTSDGERRRHRRGDDGSRDMSERVGSQRVGSQRVGS